MTTEVEDISTDQAQVVSSFQLRTCANSCTQTTYSEAASPKQVIGDHQRCVVCCNVVKFCDSAKQLIFYLFKYCCFTFSALTLLVGDRNGIRPVKNEWWGTGVVICLELGADLRMAQLMPLPNTVSCFSNIQIGFTFLVPAHPGSPGKRQ